MEFCWHFDPRFLAARVFDKQLDSHIFFNYQSMEEVILKQIRNTNQNWFPLTTTIRRSSISRMRFRRDQCEQRYQENKKYFHFYFRIVFFSNQSGPFYSDTEKLELLISILYHPVIFRREKRRKHTEERKKNKWWSLVWKSEIGKTRQEN